jgi:hypothetical protein
LRYKVGADWDSYEFLFSYAQYGRLGRLLTLGDPGYQFLNWIVQWADGSLWIVNLICGSIFAWGLYRFCMAQPNPWLCFVIAVPYLVIVVAMGYSRQAVAIGILMAGVAAIKRGASVLRFAGYVAVAALFHKTAVVILPLVIFAGERNRLLNVIAGVAGSILLYDIFVSASVETFVRNYIESEYSSQGAAIRVAMNLVPALCFLLFRRKMQFDLVEQRVWFYFSIACFALPVLLAVLPSSTVVDRLALYLIPIQLAVLSRMEYVFRGQVLGKFTVVAYSAAVLFTWLNLANHARHWVPYQIYPDLIG